MLATYFTSSKLVLTVASQIGLASMDRSRPSNFMLNLLDGKYGICGKTVLVSR